MNAMLRLIPLFVLGLAGAAAAAPPAAIARGEQVATTHGCRSCHGPDLHGKAMIDDPNIARLYSSNLTRRVAFYSNAELEHVIRAGVRPDGSHLWWMAAAPYAVLSKRDMADLVAYLRSRPPGGEDHGRIQIGPRFIKAVKAGRLKPESLTLADDLAHPPLDLGPRLARGRYLARTACAGCHTPSLRGVADAQPGDAPDLIVATGYDRDAFRTLMRTGKGVSDRDLGEMAVASRERFAGLSDADIDAMRLYLVAWSARR